MGTFRGFLAKDQNYDTWKMNRDSLEKVVNYFDKRLQTLPKGAGGLVSDETQATVEYKAMKGNFDTAFKNLQKFNKASSKEFMKRASKEARKR